MTPIELFSPYLSRAVANRIYAVSPRTAKVDIIEIGAGRGTLAKDMLQYWSETVPDFLRDVSYTIIEISPILASLQAKTLARWVDAGHVSIYNIDARKWFDSLKRDAELYEKLRYTCCHVIAMEVLDNMPHDLVRISDGVIEQATILLHDGTFKDSLSRSMEWVPDVESETSEALQMFQLPENPEYSQSVSVFPTRPSFLTVFRNHFEYLLGSGKREIWVPTGSYQLIKALIMALPHAHLTIADFNSFPGALSGENGPVVQSIGRGSATIYDSIETAPFGKVDIMFPTNFEALARGHKMLCENRGFSGSHKYRITSQQQFFDDNAFKEDKKNSSCSDGYNPILEDFENASFLLMDEESRQTNVSV